MTVWGGESETAKMGKNGLGNGLVVPIIQTPGLLINNAAYDEAHTVVVDVRSREFITWRLLNQDLPADSSYIVQGTYKEFDELSDLVAGDFDDLIMTTQADGWAADNSQQIATSLQNGTITAVAFKFKKITNDWTVSGSIRILGLA